MSEEECKCLKCSGKPQKEWPINKHPEQRANEYYSQNIEPNNFWHIASKNRRIGKIAYDEKGFILCVELNLCPVFEVC